MNQPLVRHGFNPLAPLPDEPAEAQVARWQAWFQGMGLSPDGLHWLQEAYQAGVTELPALQKWLKRPHAQADENPISHLRWLVNRLLAEGQSRAWLEWQTNLFAHLPAGSLCVSCDGSDWVQGQLLRAVLLAVQAIAGIRLVLHGVKLMAGEVPADMSLITDTPLPSSPTTILLVASRVEQAQKIVGKVSGGGNWLAEYLQLLGSGEALCRQGERWVWTSWGRNGGMRG